MSNNRPPRQPPQVPSPMERYNSSNPPTKGPVVSPTNNSTAQVYGEHYRQGHGPDRPPRPSNSTGQSLGQPPSQIRPLTGSMMPPAGLYGESHRGPSAIQSSSRNTHGPSLLMARPLDQHGSQSLSFSGPAQRNLHANTLTAHGLGTSSPPVQAPRQATRLNTAQSGSHPSTRLPASSQVTSRAQAQADPHTEFDAFLQAKGLTIRCYDDLAGSAAAAEAKDEKFLRALEISKLVVKGISIVAEINPIAKVVASAASSLLSLEETRRSNERMVYAILIQINDLLVELFELRHITIGSTNRHTPAFNKLERLMARISDDITQCVLDINSFKERKTFIKIILVTRYEETFKKHTEQFANHRAEFYHVMETLNLQITVRTEALTAKALKKIDDCLASVRSTSQTKVIAYISQVGGIEALINNGRDAKLSEMVSAEIDFSELRTEYNRTSERIGRMETLLQGMHKVVDRIDARMPSFTGDKEIDLLIKRHFTVGWDVDASNFAQEFKSTFPKNRSDPFAWVHAFIGPDYSEQIKDAYDHNASGMINYHELIRFGQSRPSGWTLLQWTTCWTAGWPMSINAMHSSIRTGLGHYDKPSNGRCPRDYILPLFDQFLQSLLLRTRDLPIIEDPVLRGHVQESAMIPQGIMRSRMAQKDFLLASGNDVQEICGDRIEFWIFALIETLLKGYLEPLQRGKLVENFRITQRSIIEAFVSRVNDISKAKRGSMESFAFGILADDVLSQPLLPSAPTKQGHAVIQKARPVEGDLLVLENTAFNNLNLTATAADHQLKKYNNFTPQELKTQMIPSQDRQVTGTRLHTGTTQLKTFRRHISSGLWDTGLKYSLRSMIGSNVLDSSGSNLLTYTRTVYGEYGQVQYASPTSGPSNNVVRLGDLGFVDKFGVFRQLLNIFDRVDPEQGGMPLEILTLPQYRRDFDIDPLTTFQTENFKCDSSGHMSPQRSYKWSSQSAKYGTIVALPDGGKVAKIHITIALEDTESIDRFDQLSLMWYHKALGRLGSNGYNGALMFVSAAYMAPVFYMASFYSEKRGTKPEISLNRYEDVGWLYLWNTEAGKENMWHTCKQPSREELEKMNGAKLPVNQICALSLTAVELGQVIWDRHFAKILPGSQALYNLANAPDPSVKSESSSMAARAAKKVGSFFKQS